MREERLLRRIRTLKKEPHRTAREEPHRVVQSVMEHLQRLLNSRQGNVPIAEDYGVPDLTDVAYTYPDSVREVERALRNTIQRYEPRLRNVRVSSLPPDESSPLNLRFEVKARLAQGDERIFFETLIDPEGKVQVR